MDGAPADERRRAADQLPGHGCAADFKLAVQEQPMSEAKREHSLFRHTGAALPPSARSGARAAAALPATTIVELRLVEPWEPGAAGGADPAAGADPYNAVGTHVIRSARPRP
jgi:hypothetical protein